MQLLQGAVSNEFFFQVFSTPVTIKFMDIQLFTYFSISSNKTKNKPIILKNVCSN